MPKKLNQRNEHFEECGQRIYFGQLGELRFQKQVARYGRSRVLKAPPGERAVPRGCAHGAPGQLPRQRPWGARLACAPRLRQRSSGVREGPKFTHCSELRGRKSEGQMPDLGTSPNPFLEKVRLSQQKQPRREERF